MPPAPPRDPDDIERENHNLRVYRRLLRWIGAFTDVLNRVDPRTLPPAAAAEMEKLITLLRNLSEKYSAFLDRERKRRSDHRGRNRNEFLG